MSCLVQFYSNDAPALPVRVSLTPQGVRAGAAAQATLFSLVAEGKNRRGRGEEVGEEVRAADGTHLWRSAIRDLLGKLQTL